MAFQKIVTVTLQTPTAQKMTEYVDILVRHWNGDPATMNSSQKTDFVLNYLFIIMKSGIKSQSDIEKKEATVLEDVEGNLTQV